MLIAIVVLLALQVLFTLSLHAAITNLAGALQRQAPRTAILRMADRGYGREA